MNTKRRCVEIRVRSVLNNVNIDIKVDRRHRRHIKGRGLLESLHVGLRTSRCSGDFTIGRFVFRDLRNKGCENSAWRSFK